MSNKWILSATEIETFELCRRKWAYQYLDEIKTPPSKAARFGSAVHSFLQNHLTGNAIDYQTAEGRVIFPGLGFLPKRLAHENVERPIFFSKHGLMFRGYIDFVEQIDATTFLIGDHKTASNLRYALAIHELKKNTQANIYAQWAFTERAAELVKLRWVYYRTSSSPKAMSVDTELSKSEAEENFLNIADTGNKILAIVKDGPPSIKQPRNSAACFKYGRCHFFDRCSGEARTTFTKKNKLEEALMKQIDHDVKDKSFHLYIDCMPTKNEAAYERTIELSELLKPVLTKIQTEKELSHYRLAGYGQHVGLIANYLSEHLKSNAYKSDTAILSSVKTPEGCDTLQTLTAAAGQVVRGF